MTMHWRTQNTALTLEPTDSSMEPQATQADNESPRGPLRFSYASGARPLAGYTIKRGIGRGGFGEVYFAVSDGGKEVAIKLIRHNLDVELRGVAQCLNLKHPNLIALYDVKRDEQDNTWVVMEYATGESLEDVIRRSPDGLPVEEAMEWMRGIAAGVAYLHDHGIVHRDLKPGNIFRDDGQVKLGDYGLSKFISCSRRSGQTESIGTVHYMAPEVANGRYGKEIDIYALGIILYETLTGHVPFEGESVGEVLMKHLTAEPSLAEVPESYRNVIARALAKDPTRRFSSVSEMMNSLPPMAATIAYFPPPREAPTAVEPEPAPADATAAAPPPPPGGQAFAGAAMVQAAAAVDEEPIWRALREGWQTTRDYWDSFNVPTKTIVLVIATIVLARSSWVLELLVALAVVYALYRIARAVVLYQEQKKSGAAVSGSSYGGSASSGQTATYRPAPAAARREPPPQATTYQPAAGVAPGDWRSASQRHWKKKHSRRAWREQAAAALVIKPTRERLADLAGSLMLAAAIGAAMSVVVVLVTRQQDIEKEQFAWLTLVSVLGSWSVLTASKFWEGTQGDALLRRVVLLMVGLGVGSAGFYAAQELLIKFPDTPMSGVASVRISPREIGTGFFDANGSPLQPAYLAFFGALFALVGWW